MIKWLVKGNFRQLIVVPLPELEAASGKAERSGFLPQPTSNIAKIIAKYSVIF